MDEPISSLVDTGWLYTSFGEAAALDILFFFPDCLPFSALFGCVALFWRESSKEIESFPSLLSGVCLYRIEK